ncbi:Hsp33 family molecular chaperone HslO [Anaerotignum sp. MSJ-24]|uniref:Hsp33 family molecular chaperone HslO n=1 Tax=Anaerotignum sp. MSJ-24 TaxID=2841521 RepID=UPI001C10E873|nr:Hsp33 family molecular chaperone HslO [Anaerotignum sp. MSJ-24]MBU5464623.1 Hsp33 family molecular chaperone HslO [Anaerotignum sp. MSJ-24]
MDDYILRATAADGLIRAFAATTKNTVQTARSLHNTTPVASAALGRLLTAGAMMGTMLKGEKDLVTLQIKGDGPIEGLLVTADSKGRVKGYPFNPNVDIPPKSPVKLDVGGAVGKGYLTVIKDLGLKEPYVGKTELVSGEIAEDLTYYYAKSEQIPTAIALGVLVDTDTSIKAAGGFIIQLMPGATLEVATMLEERITHLKYITELLDRGETPETILDAVLGDMDLEIIDKMPTEFYCDCSRERVEKALISIGEKDLRTILEEDKKAEISCHFCNKVYNFDEADLKKLLDEATSK